MAKGSEYERKICRTLSLWWSEGQDDDLFWRTAGSGARGTVRRKKGKKSKEASDIRASDKDAAKFTKLIATEIKRGYSKTSMMDAIDRPPQIKPTSFELFIRQAYKAAQNESTPYWALIHRRDRKEAMIFIPWELTGVLRKHGAIFGDPPPVLHVRVRIKTRRVKKKWKWKTIWFYGCTLPTFLKVVTPSIIRKAYKEYCGASRH